ncbi:MAG TPA: signal peptidase II [Tepidisphaeraceae bacterium]|nr:signal peptidase II [Tepidisphaeraceae bacterium]
MSATTWTDTVRSPVALLCFLGTAAVAIGADLWSKAAAVEHLKHGPVVRFIPRLVQFEYTENRGAVFGLGQGQQALFVVVSVAAVAFLTWLFATSGRSRFYQVVLGMLLAGVIGNMYDRLRYGYVRDMIHGLPNVYWPDWFMRMLPQRWQPPFGQGLEVFPWIFNIADALLCVGVFLMIVYSFVSERQRKRLTALAEAAGQKLGAEPPDAPASATSTDRS